MQRNRYMCVPPRQEMWEINEISQQAKEEKNTDGVNISTSWLPVAKSTRLEEEEPDAGRSEAGRT